MTTTDLPAETPAPPAPRGPVAIGPATVKVRDADGTIALVTLPDCFCPDMVFHHWEGGDDGPHCKHLAAFYEHLVDLVAPDQRTYIMGSLTGATYADGTPVGYELTLMHCTIHGTLGRRDADGRPFFCDHAVAAFTHGTGWQPVHGADEEEGPIVNPDDPDHVRRYLAYRARSNPAFTFTVASLVRELAEKVECTYSLAWYRQAVRALQERGMVRRDGKPGSPYICTERLTLQRVA